MPSKYCGNLPRCKNSWWCATDFRPSENAECFTAMTNYDRIIRKSPEELAEYLAEVANDGGGSCAPGCYDCTNHSCKDKWLDWLRQEATEG